MPLNCDDFNNVLDDFLDRRLSNEDAEAIRAHHASCPKCTETLIARETLGYRLRHLPVPPASLGFESRVLRIAAERNRPAPARRLALLPIALAASLLLAIGVAGLAMHQPAPSPELGSESASQFVWMAQTKQTMRLVFKAPKALSGAKLRVELPAGVEFASHPGQRVLEWTTDLAAGDNLLEVPVVGQSSEPLVATLAVGRAERRFYASLTPKAHVSGQSPISASEEINHA